MAWLEAALILMAATAALVAGFCLRAWLRLRNHPHVEPLERAAPDLAPSLNEMVRRMAARIGVEPPPIRIRRARLPNAFVVASFLRPELYLTDELLEECDQREDGLDFLEQAICHELMHIRRGDALPLGALHMAAFVASALGLHRLESRFMDRIEAIERETNADVRAFLGQPGDSGIAPDAQAECLDEATR